MKFCFLIGSESTLVKSTEKEAVFAGLVLCFCLSGAGYTFGCIFRIIWIIILKYYSFKDKKRG